MDLGSRFRRRQARIDRCHVSSRTIVAQYQVLTADYPRETVETLLAHGFKPTRTVVLAFGMDEEIGGTHVSVLSMTQVSD